MAVYKLFPEKDATLYSMFPNMNTGLDEIVEATLTSIAPNDPNPQVSRFLIKFDQSKIQDIIDNKIGNAEWDVNLRCFISKTTGLSDTTTLDIFAVSGAWDMGTGKYLDDPITTDGTSWIWQNYSGSNMWNVMSPGNNVTSSYNITYAPLGGGTWYNQIVSSSTNAPLSSSQQYTYASDKDLDVSVKNIVDVWVTGSINYYDSPSAISTNTTSSISASNQGFLIKQKLEWSDTDNYQPEIKFFSIDTNTIYPPQLEFKWVDYSYSPGSLPVIETLPATVLLASNPGVFFPESKNRFRINSRPEYPPRVWQTSSVYLNNYVLPTASYWALKDLDTNEYVIDFDTTYTQLSCDNSGSYFDMNMNGLQPERYYQILIQTEIDGSTMVYADQYYFKVING
tara:strand:+ start:958 stop:2145 length:1188 start_codon:yes stop_codon:yes gene_type:complete